MHTPETLNALVSNGLIGSWHIDFTAHKMRGTGNVASYFGLKKPKVRDGVDLDMLDSAYLPEDLELIKRNRRIIASKGGRHHLTYKLRDPKSGALVPVRSMMDVTVNPYGGLREAKGVLFREPESFIISGKRALTYEDALRSLSEAIKAVEAVGLSHLVPIAKVIFKEVAQEAIVQALGPAQD